MQRSRACSQSSGATAVLAVVRGTGGNLILQPAEALALAQHRQHVEDRGEVVRPVSAARSGWATLPSLTPLRSAKARDGLFGRLGVPGLDRAEVFRDRASSARASGVSSACAPCRRARAGGRQQMKRAPSTSSTSVLARSFRPGMAASSFARSVRRQLGGELRPRRRCAAARARRSSRRSASAVWRM